MHLNVCGGYTGLLTDDIPSPYPCTDLDLSTVRPDEPAHYPPPDFDIKTTNDMMRENPPSPYVIHDPSLKVCEGRERQGLPEERDEYQGPICHVSEDGPPGQCPVSDAEESPAEEGSADSADNAEESPAEKGSADSVDDENADQSAAADSIESAAAEATAAEAEEDFLAADELTAADLDDGEAEEGMPGEGEAEEGAPGKGETEEEAPGEGNIDDELQTDEVFLHSILSHIHKKH